MAHCCIHMPCLGGLALVICGSVATKHYAFDVEHVSSVHRRRQLARFAHIYPVAHNHGAVLFQQIGCNQALRLLHNPPVVLVSVEVESLEDAQCRLVTIIVELLCKRNHLQSTDHWHECLVKCPVFGFWGEPNALPYAIWQPNWRRQCHLLTVE